VVRTQYSIKHESPILMIHIDRDREASRIFMRDNQIFECRMPSEIDSVIRIGARHTHVLNKMSAANVIEWLDIYELFTYYPREYI